MAYRDDLLIGIQAYILEYSTDLDALVMSQSLRNTIKDHAYKSGSGYSSTRFCSKERRDSFMGVPIYVIPDKAAGQLIGLDSFLGLPINNALELVEQAGIVDESSEGG